MRRRSKHEKDNTEKRETKYGNIRIEENSLKHSIVLGKQSSEVDTQLTDSNSEGSAISTM